MRISKPRKAVLAEMKRQLHLNSEQFRRTEEILHNYDQERQNIFGLVKKEGNLKIGSFEYLERLKKASGDANKRLKGVLCDDRYRLLAARNYDRRLGIRMPEEIFSDGTEKKLP